MPRLPRTELKGTFMDADGRVWLSCLKQDRHQRLHATGFTWGRTTQNVAGPLGTSGVDQMVALAGCSLGTDFGQVEFEPAPMPAALKLALDLGFSEAY